MEGSGLTFGWLDLPSAEPGSGLLLPKGSARFSRLQFHGADLIAATFESMARTDGRLEIGRTVSVIPDEARPVLLSLTDGWTWTSGYDPDHTPIALNSSLDLLVTCIGAYEVWHARLLALGEHDGDEFDAALARARALFSALDPTAAQVEENWWTRSIEGIEGLV